MGSLFPPDRGNWQMGGRAVLSGNFCFTLELLTPASVCSVGLLFHDLKIKPNKIFVGLLALGGSCCVCQILPASLISAAVYRLSSPSPAPLLPGVCLFLRCDCSVVRLLAAFGGRDIRLYLRSLFPRPSFCWNLRSVRATQALTRRRTWTTTNTLVPHTQTERLYRLKAQWKRRHSFTSVLQLVFNCGRHQLYLRENIWNIYLNANLYPEFFVSTNFHVNHLQHQ